MQNPCRTAALALVEMCNLVYSKAKGVDYGSFLRQAQGARKKGRDRQHRVLGWRCRWQKCHLIGIHILIEARLALPYQWLAMPFGACRADAIGVSAVKRIILAALLLGVPATSLLAEAPAGAAAYSTAQTTIGDLLDNPDAKAVVDKYMPGFSTNPQADMARSMTFKQIQAFAPDQIKDETLARIDADLAKISTKK